MVSPLLRQAIIKSGMMHVASDELASRLATIAEALYTNRAVEPLREAADLLACLPEPRAKAAGLFYQAMCECIAGTDEKAEPLLRAVIGMNCAPKYQARALQSLGIIHRYANDTAQAAELYQRAMRQGEKCQDFVTVIRAGMTIAELSTSEGDHRTSLKHLKAIRPAIEIAARFAPFYIPAWCNDVAIDLAGLGRLDEARRFAAFAIASPFARAYPEWRETAQGIEQQAEARPALQQARKTSPRPKLRLVKKSRPRALPAPTRHRIGPVAIIRPEPPRSRPILEQISFKVQIRAPSF